MTTTASPTSAATRTQAAPYRGRTLLTALIVASPLWASVSLAQAATRDGFDLTRHPLSMLATGSLGWLQITNFILAGILTLIGAAGLKRTLASKWIPRLAGVYGIGMILSGVFTMDAGDGFPAGTPQGPPATLSWHAGLHLLFGCLSFVALTAALFVLGRHFSRRGERTWAVIARIGAVAVIVANVGSMAGAPGPSVWLAAGVISAMLVLSAITAKLRHDA
ncbi:DUF998 domain-containing protein [Kribbella deserti]|uniref:DUF998 domain-containing protein n=1 Tax=Kribbella deserti TaxID=1926257 RepID=A0ABV6QYA9_9ACTN